jgi:hypothetical protein
MRIFGAVLIFAGFLICLTIIGIPFGLFLMFIGVLCVIFGGRRRTVITNIVQVSTTPGVQMAQVPHEGDYGDSVRTLEPPRQEPRVVNPPRQTAWIPRDSGIIDAAPLASTNYGYDRKKFDALVAYDEDIKRIVDGLQPYGPKFVDQFAAAFLALNDKEYLPMIVKKILETARQEQAAARSR